MAIIPGLVTIIIPSYNHGTLVAEAIESALAQTAACEVLVVDDGSTDETSDVLTRYGGRIRAFHIPHQGPSAARNVGLEQGRGEFVMFLDADDVLQPTKVAVQLQEFVEAPDAGWILCDVEIVDDGRGHRELASDRYNYAAREMSGWIDAMLESSNFIPIMAPLVRRSVLEDIRFFDTADGTPEDWRFWQRVACAARVRYVPAVLATYRKRKTGRNRLPTAARAVVPNIVEPLRLNLGCGTQGTRSWHPMDGMVNLDKSLGWRFEDGLGAFADRSVTGITISHALMYVQEADWPRVFEEFARVLRPGGVVRITEDDAVHHASARRGGWRGSESAVTLTSPALVHAHLARVGLRVASMTEDRSFRPELGLRQAQHGVPPDVFFLEGIREQTLLLSPHSDDETLFAAFSILRYRPHVVICYPSTGDYGDTAVREAETRAAMEVLGGGPVEQWAGGDLVSQFHALDARLLPSRVLAPHHRSSHPDHVTVANAALEVFGSRVMAFHTYDSSGKVRMGTPASIEPGWVHQKLRALTRYESQVTHPRAQKFFLWDLHEYVEGEP